MAYLWFLNSIRSDIDNRQVSVWVAMAVQTAGDLVDLLQQITATTFLRTIRLLLHLECLDEGRRKVVKNREWMSSTCCYLQEQ